MLFFQRFCRFVWINLLISGFKSVYGILNLLEAKSRTDLAVESALSFPLTLMWLGIQQIRISFELDIGSNLLFNY